MYCRLKESCIFDDAAFLKRKLRNVEMIKIRLMGEREEIKIIIENISHINDVRILSLSDFYANRGGASDYGRIYMEVEKKDAV